MDILILIAIAFVAGLVVGWTVLPEPAWIRKIFIKWGWAKPTEP